MKPPKEWEKGLAASCWHCDTEFTKTDYCSSCGYYVCPKCGQCGCHLKPEVKKAMDKTFEALTPVFKAYRNKIKVLERIHRQMLQLEYILDSTNQRRKRKDKEVKKAWGHAFAIKGLINDLLTYYQPTLLMINEKFCRTTPNPTWTKRAQKIYVIAQASKVSLSSKTSKEATQK